MSRINFKYQLNDRLAPLELVLFGMQWLAISIPTLIIIGKVVTQLHFNDPARQIVYLQKLFFVTGLILLGQLLWGHRLPVILGPAAVLLVSIIASIENGINTIYSSILTGGGILFLLSITGLFGYIQRYFTPRVIVTILLLIPVTLAPTIIDLLTKSEAQASPVVNLTFAMVLVFSMFTAGKYLTGLWKATIIIWGTVLGSVSYLVLFSHYGFWGYKYHVSAIDTFFRNFNTSMSLNPVVIFSFLISFLALAINDVGSIQAVGELINPDNMSQRISRGLAITGVGNILSGFAGVIGPVNFSFSPGVIVSSGCASRYALIPAGIGLIILAFLPGIIAFMGSVPSVVVGSILIYIMSSQIAAALLMTFNSLEKFTLESGITIGFPVMLGIIVSFLPPDILNTLSSSLKPLAGNGFVVGVVTVLILEHVIYKNKG
ncbi:MAG: purine/pyrimidine permease [Thermoanaerobacteraceae bacterium]|nr:purine/pyrimidine permease [Thermoanaerobacteraceae bacterium]